MPSIKRPAFVAGLRANGFEGKLEGDVSAQTDTVWKWMQDSGVAFAGPDGKTLDRDGVGVALKTVVVTIDPQAGEEVEVRGPEAPAEEAPEEPMAESQARSGPKPTPKTFKAKRTGMVNPNSGMAPAGAPGIRSNESRLAKVYNVRSQQRDPRTGKRKTVFENGDVAEAFGSWIRLATAGAYGYDQMTRDNEVLEYHGLKAHSTVVNSAGGATVPDLFDAELINLQDEFGVARQLARMTPMSSGYLERPRLTGGVTASWAAENSSLTSADMSFDNVTLTAKKLTALTVSSAEILNDSAINIADTIAQEIARAFADEEDDAYLNGDASSTYGGFTGARIKLAAGTANVAYFDVSGTTWADINIDDFTGTMGLLPPFANQGAVWLCSSQFWHTVMLDRLADANGNNIAALEAGAAGARFLGYPVVLSQRMPRAAANGAVNAIFGNFNLASMMGEVTGSRQILTSDQRYFELDQIAIRGTERVCFNTHDVGGSDTANPNSPLIGLYL